MNEKGSWSNAIWRRLAEQGLLGLPFAEAEAASAPARWKP